MMPHRTSRSTWSASARFVLAIGAGLAGANAGSGAGTGAGGWGPSPARAAPTIPAPAASERRAPTATDPAAPADRSTPARTEAPGAPGLVPDLNRLRAEYDRLREELFKARVRSQKASEIAYPSKLDARLRWKGGPDFVIRRARFLLDGAELWDSSDRGQTDDLIEVAERSVKPGPHALAVRLEIRPRAETKGGTKTGADRLGYTSEHTFAIIVAPTGHTHLLLTGDEDGDPPEYESTLELEIEADK